MPRNKIKSPNPINVPAVGVVESGARFLTSQRGVFRATEPILNQDPATRVYLAQGRGLSGLMETTRDVRLQRNTFNSISSAQNSLFVSRVSNNNFATLPNLQEMYDGIGQNVRIATDILDRLKECCETLQQKIDDLRRHLNRVGNSLKSLINHKFESLSNYLNQKFNNLTDLINNARESLSQHIDENTTTLKDQIVDTEGHLNTKLNTVQGHIDQTITAAHTTTRTEILAAIGEAQAAITVELGLVAGAVAKGFTFLELAVLTPAFAGIGTTLAGIEATLITIKTQITSVSEAVIKLPETLQQKLDDLLEKIKEHLKEFKEELIKEIVDQVSLTVVGEAYQSWDSLSTYFPALTFIFNEENASNRPRKSQIKVRLKMKNQELTDQDIAKLRENTKKSSQMRYSYGCVRGNYVHNDKKFKTTIWGKDDQEITNVLNQIMLITDQQLDKQCLSFTRGGTKRLNISKRVIPLDNVQLNPMDYREPFNLKLRSAVLLVNGLKSPIRIF